MPTNANVFNSRVTSEALEAKFRQVFPAQGGAELVQDLFASGVIQPVVDFSTVAEGSVLPVNLQTAWDFSTGHQLLNNASANLVTNTGFWLVDLTMTMEYDGATRSANISLSDGLSTKVIWQVNNNPGSTTTTGISSLEDKFIVFLRAGDTLTGQSVSTGVQLNVWWRQIADVNGNLVNPLGFTFS